MQKENKMIYKSNGNFNRLVNQAADQMIDESMREHCDSLNAMGKEKELEMLLSKIKEIKKSIRKELRENWKPRNW